MGFMFRVRLLSFFAGAAASSVGGFYYLYKDYMLAQQAISQQISFMCSFTSMSTYQKADKRHQKMICGKVRENYESLEGRYEALSARITALENPKPVETAMPVEGI